MYDMYPWDQPTKTDKDAKAGPAVQAVQAALDRRDNGGEASVSASR